MSKSRVSTGTSWIWSGCSFFRWFTSCRRGSSSEDGVVTKLSRSATPNDGCNSVSDRRTSGRRATASFQRPVLVGMGCFAGHDGRRSLPGLPEHGTGSDANHSNGAFPPQSWTHHWLLHAHEV